MDDLDEGASSSTLNNHGVAEKDELDEGASSSTLNNDGVSEKDVQDLVFLSTCQREETGKTADDKKKRKSSRRSKPLRRFELIE